MINYWKCQHINRGYYPGGTVDYENFSYIPIPKNSSSYMTTLLTLNGWEIYDFLSSNIQDKKFIVLLRDPVTRWISGISQYFCSYITEPNYSASDIIDLWDKTTESLVFDRIIFDDHTEKQTYFISGIPINQCTFFKSSTELDSIIQKFLAENSFNLDVDFSIDKNDSRESTDNLAFSIFFKELLLEKPHLVEKIKQTYKEDYNLINSINFYE